MSATVDVSILRDTRAKMTSNRVTIKSGMPLEFKDKSPLVLVNGGHGNATPGKDTNEHTRGNMTRNRRGGSRKHHQQTPTNESSHGSASISVRLPNRKAFFIGHPRAKSFPENNRNSLPQRKTVLLPPALPFSSPWNSRPRRGLPRRLAGLRTWMRCGQFQSEQEVWRHH